LQVTFQQWEQLPASSSGEREVLLKELLSACESIEWQVKKNFVIVDVFSFFSSRVKQNVACYEVL